MKTKSWKTAPFRAACIALVAMLSGAGVLGAADNQGGQTTQQPASLTAKASEAFGKVSPLIEAKNWEAAFIVIRDVLNTSAPGSYDLAYANLMLAQTHLMRGSNADNDFIKAIPAMEHVINSGYWAREKVVDWLYILAQLCAMNKENDKAERYVLQWLAETPRPTPEGYMFAASLKLQKAQTNLENMDLALVKDALELANKGLLLGVKPHDQLLYLKVVCLQSLARTDEAAEMLELIVAKNPQNKTYWAMLFGAYVQSQRMLRAVLTLERAQEHGAMNSPKENLQLVHLYYNMEQYDKTIELLEQGLDNGTIERERGNYDLLAYALQQMHREFKAIEVYKKQAEIVKSGEPYVQIGNLYYQLRQNGKALESFEEALRRGGLENTGGLMIFSAHLAMELRQLDKALDLLARAEPNLKTDQERSQHKGLRMAVEDAIRVREEEKKANEKATG